MGKFVLAEQRGVNNHLNSTGRTQYLKSKRSGLRTQYV